ncbi:DUF1016 N-terminal domain-containing protein [Sorangium sp. So ce295]|jgi:hypothetical protein|uniref:DUF1016 N-terminal domain-containing protein n=1 Tax=Sorangium sp. So ce295 TaxID=3133295 RepID=UPI003F619CFD
MVQFAGAFPEEPIVAALSRQLTWSHFVLLLPLEAPLAHAFHTEMCRVERWMARPPRARAENGGVAAPRQPSTICQQKTSGTRLGGGRAPVL